MASSPLEQCSTSISRSLRTRRRTRTVLSSELSSKDFSSMFQITVSNHDSDRFLWPSGFAEADVDDGECFCAAPSLAPDRVDRRLPRGAITIKRPRSHSKSMTFRGQRHDLVFRLLRSPSCSGNLSPDDAPTSFIG